VRAIARPVLRHRMFTNFNADSEGVSVEDIIGRLLKTVKEPDEGDYARKAHHRRKATAPAAEAGADDEPTDS